MATATQRMHQALAGYVAPSRGVPPGFGLPTEPLRARLPLGPTSSIPEGHRPIPASTESNKKTNAQIPYVRVVHSEVGIGGLRASPQEGDIVFVERTEMLQKPEHPGARLGHGTNTYARVRTIESLNAELQTPRDAAYTHATFPYSLDGVINNVDSEDALNEFRDYTIANVAVYGPCRLDHGEATRCDFKKTHPGSVLHVGLVKQPVEGGGFTHRLVRFSSAQLTRGVYAVDDRLVCAWVLGMMIDSNQSKNMVTVHVNVSLVRDIESSVDDGQIFTNAKGKKYLVHASLLEDPRWQKEGLVEEAIGTTLSAREQLAAKWDAPELRPESAQSSKSAAWP